jgi:uncharacterized protein YyaL (SSP411 family)
MTTRRLFGVTLHSVRRAAKPRLVPQDEYSVQSRMVNGLAQERSAYLRQHRSNPVNWLPWGEAALSEAKTFNKPILLSIGYSACHWCHVMARESFEDPEIAALMNQGFVNIKVDREERPDLDALYLKALQAMGRRPGWPLTMFLTPDGVPFWGGNIFRTKGRTGCRHSAKCSNMSATPTGRTRRASHRRDAR